MHYYCSVGPNSTHITEKGGGKAHEIHFVIGGGGSALMLLEHLKAVKCFAPANALYVDNK